ncbi:DEAD/DEAH box helicase [Radiobacillus kanasensis]|uniref:DEAD/DEAH box helicase n=1 Tax=Radiobacillus kanasensis TaxID=2844358 RepID=UPI001E4F6703|nr:DEAD/DEAH box helicase [Radiobacillus kanasensis]UFU00824.1 DEAD/DEAH box helicase [Radiobacillus kanasensis]
MELTNMKSFIQTGWEREGFGNATPIQTRTIPLIQEGKDVIGESPTGSGKTLAYLLPILDKLDPNIKNAQAIIMASSQELVMQIQQEITKWVNGTELHSAALIGGANIKRQIEKLKKKPQLVVGTPGRVLELINQKKLKMQEIKTVVLDEGDQLLIPEHLDSIGKIVKSTDDARQVLIFSATLPESTLEAAKQLVNNPEVIRIGEEEVDRPEVEHIYFVCEQREKVDMLKRLIHHLEIRGLAFFRSISHLDTFAEKLRYNGVEVGLLHRDIKKQERAQTMKHFRSGNLPLILATDVAARGLDVKGLTHIVQVELPEDALHYAHRAGRVGRLGSESGTVISLVTEEESKILKRFAKNRGIVLKKKKIIKGQVVDAK